MKYAVIALIGISLIGLAIYRSETAVIEPVVPVEVEKVEKVEAPVGGHEGISDAIIDRQIAKAGTSWPEIQGWVVKIRGLFGTLKDPARQPAPEPTPDSISTEYDEPKPLTEYQFAYTQAKLSGKPLVLFITQDGCVPCQIKNRDVIHPMKVAGDFDDCRFQAVNRTHDKEAALIAGQQNGVPQVVVYHVLDGVAPGSRLVGNEITADRVRSLLKGAK